MTEPRSAGLPSLAPAVYEAFAGLQDWRGLRKQRRRVGLASAGQVLEIGVGTGRNLRHFTKADHVVGIDPDRGMLARAAKQAGRSSCEVELLVASAEQLPFPAASFDAVVSTLTLCTIPDPGLALTEIRRVLRPGGRFVFLEHERSPNRAIAKLQDLATPVWHSLSGGCDLNRTTALTIRRHGFEVGNLWRSRGGAGGLIQGIATIAPSPF